MKIESEIVNDRPWLVFQAESFGEWCNLENLDNKLVGDCEEKVEATILTVLDQRQWRLSIPVHYSPPR